MMSGSENQGAYHEQYRKTSYHHLIVSERSLELSLLEYH